MSVREIVKIDSDLCDGCGECIVNCPEGALQLVDGKARLVKESYCDGLGACLGTCPLGAITIERRGADPFDEEAVEQNMARAEAEKKRLSALPVVPCDCPGAAVRQREFVPLGGQDPADADPADADPAGSGSTDARSQLSHWPVQLTLVPPDAPFLQGADLLLVADCVPFALAEFHGRILRGRPVVVGCPKLDNAQSYVEKLTDVFRQSSLRSLTIVHMEVPCCTGLCRIAETAMKTAGRPIPLSEITVSVDGRVIAEQER